jgi:predicted Ser/Thr protein kinase
MSATLNNRNRVRHTAFAQGILTMMGITNNTGKPIKLLTRLGGRRSLDGVVFDIGNGKVAKVMFVGRGAISNINSIKNEFKVQKKLGDAGIGPKTYKLIEFKLPATLLNLKNQIGSAISNWPTHNNAKRLIRQDWGVGSSKLRPRNFMMINNIISNGKRSTTFNLFQQWYYNRNNNYNNVKTGAIIIMENLYSGPGIKTAMTVNEMYEKKMPIPLDKMAKAIKKMHDLGISHNDLHWGNIMVQIKTDGSERVVIIDFGRAKDPGTVHNIEWNRNTIKHILVQYGGQKQANVNAAFGKTSSSQGPAFPRPLKSALTTPLSSYGLMKAASGGYRIKGKRGPIKPTKLPAAELRYYALNYGVPVNAIQKATKKQLMNMIYAAKGGAAIAPSRPAKAPASSYGLVFNKGSVRMRGKKGGLIKTTKLTVAELRAYAAKKGINLAGAKLKKDILHRLAK